MRNTFSTLTGVGLVMMAAAGIVAPAQAHAEDGSVTVSAEQFRQLQEQVAELRQELEQTKAAQQATQQQASQAQAVAVQAQTTATAAAKAPKLASWADDTKISGRMYFNISKVSTSYDGVKSQDQGGFQIKRFYIGIDHKFSNVFSGNVTVDVDNVANSSGSNVGKGLYVKKAYLKATFNKAFAVALGATDMPWIPYVEGVYGYRHVEKTTTDLFGYGTSSDWGVHVMGDLADGLVSYQVSAVDGGGYRNPTFTNTVDLEGRLSLKYKGFNAAVGGYSGKLGNDTDPVSTAYRTATRFNAMLAYKDKIGGMPVTIGGEYFTAKNWKVKASSAEDKAEGYSLFASISPVDKWSVFGRYDWVKPNKDTAPSKKGEMFNVGLQYSPAKIVDLALVYKRYNGDYGFKGGDFSNSSSYISGKQDEFGLFGQFRF